MSDRPLILSCEHATNDVPPFLGSLFSGEEALLRSHRGYDPGAAELAGNLAQHFGVPLECSKVTRLIVDLNRSEYHPQLFSKFTHGLHPETRQALLDKYYRPFRERVAVLVEARLRCLGRVVHLSVHSFTPELDGVVRDADIGLLYDPSRMRERELARSWKQRLEDMDPSLRVRFNYPYHGTADGHVTLLRSRFEGRSYLGIELEVNQHFVLGAQADWERIQAVIEESLAGLVEIQDH